ncbi:hypothetical protein [Ellagibacter isourolithinifaciens]
MATKLSISKEKTAELIKEFGKPDRSTVFAAFRSILRVCSLASESLPPD